jgi:imidazolonepropionase-like amidohydrolase
LGVPPSGSISIDAKHVSASALNFTMNRTDANRSPQVFRMHFKLLFVCFYCCSLPAWARTDNQPAEIIAVVGAELRTCEPHGTILNGVVLIQGESILAVGDSTLAIPADAKKIDAKGFVITPGLIDARSKLWLASDSVAATASDASLDIVDGIDPYSENWHEVLASGVTTVYLQPAARGTLGGYGAVVSVMPKPVEGVGVIAVKAGLQASVGVSSSSNRSRQQDLERTKKILDSAVEYRKKWEEYDAFIAKQAKETPPKKPELDPSKQDLVRVIKGEIPLRLEVHGPDDIAFAMKLFESQALKGIQIVFEGLSDLRSAGMVVRDLKLPVVLGPWLEIEQATGEPNNSVVSWGADFSSYEGVVAIATNGKSGQSSKLLRAHAAKAISFGFSQDRALKAITIDAALALGVSDRIGSLAKGKRADLVCFRGEPTNPANPAVWVMSGGVLVEKMGLSTASAQQKWADPQIDLSPSFLANLLPNPLPKSFSIQSSRCWLEGRLQPATLQVNEGKIVGILKKDAIKKGTEESPLFDVTDVIVSPGLFSGHANFGLERVIDPQSESDASLVVAADGVARDFHGETKLVRNGLLRALLAPGSSNPISGSASLIRIGAKESAPVRDAATKFVLSNSARNQNRFPSSLAGQIQIVSQSLKGVLLPSRVYLPVTVEQRIDDRRLLTLKEVASGKRVAIIEAQSDAEMRAALQLIETYKLNALLLGPNQLNTHMDRIQKSKATIVVEPLTASSFDWYVDDIVQAAKAGIPICFAGESAEQLRLVAALAVAAGADHDQMFRALCEIPKALLDPTISSGLAIGGPADFVLWSGSPLHLGAKPLHVLVDGQLATRKGN